MPVPTTFLQSQALLPKADTLRRLAISESGFVFDPATGNSFTINETGLLILRALQAQQDIDLIAARLVSEYDIDARDLERDLIEFCGTLRDYFNT
jgi:hypothetical protein